jgi:RES domain-containing protein
LKAPATAYRPHNPLWSHSPLSGVGAARHGGRFNRIGLPALYLSVNYETAVLEASQGFKNKMQPLTIVQYEVDCDDIVDLTDSAERKRWNISPAELACGWQVLALTGLPVPTWELADRMRKRGCAGIQVRSFAPGATKKNVNLVLWKWRRPPHKVVVIDDEERLPKPPLA